MDTLELMWDILDGRAAKLLEPCNLLDFLVCRRLQPEL